MTDILGQLQRASWRQIEFPVMHVRDFGFEHEQSLKKFLFLDAQIVESLGRKNPTYKYIIPFREDIAKGPWKNLFTSVYPDFLDACQDRTRGVLVDPAHGALPAKCVSLRETLDVGRRDGVDVEVQFIRAPTEDDIVEDLGTQIRTLEGARDSAGAFDAAIAKIPSLQKAPPAPTINALDTISSIANQVEVSADQVTAAFADSAFRLEKTTASLKALGDPTVQPLLQQAARLKNALLNLNARSSATPHRPVRELTATSNQTVSAIAKKTGMSVKDLVALNPWMARSPLVASGRKVRVFADSIKPSNAHPA
jgi:hypothetical protein